MKTTLVIMAAGLGSRFGNGIKQLEPVGLNGELIMDYSIHDAIQVGFNKIIFIIRHDIEKDFKEIIGNRIENICNRLNVEVQYAYQSLDDLPIGFSVPNGRTKPWGTGQAVLSCKNLLNEPFAVINADDYYGKNAFLKIHNFLEKSINESCNHFCMAGFILKNTLSEYGTVTRGICSINEDSDLINVIETQNILKTTIGIEANGILIDENSYVSMNMWGFTPDFMKLLETGFLDFLGNLKDNELKSEYLIPIYINQLLSNKKISVKLLESNDKWFGMTYKEDIPFVVSSFRELVDNGIYQENLFNDLM